MRWVLKTGIALGFAVGLTAGFGRPADAQIPLSGFREHIRSFDAAISVGRDSQATVTETIVYDFGTLPDKHGIFRYIPTRYKDPEGNTYYSEFAVVGVTDESGREYNFERSSSGANQVLKIGDADVTVSGAKTYKISYTLVPVIRQGNGTDFFIFNVTGNDWRVPIAESRATVSFAAGVTPVATACYSGVVGSRASECRLGPAPNGFTVQSSRPWFPGEGLTVASDLPAGSANRYLVANQRPPIHWQRGTGYIFGVLAGLATLLFVIIWIIYTRWRQSRETEVPQYESPDNLSPAEIGLLVDRSSNLTEVTATLIDLAVRGYLKIEQTAGKGLLRKAQYRFTKLSKSGRLRPYETTLLEAVFAGGDTVTVAELDRTKMAAAVKVFQSSVRSSAERQGYLAKPASQLPKWLRWLVGLVAVAAFGFAVANGGEPTGNAGAAFGGLVFFLAFSYRTSLTKAGYAEWGEIAGFRRFLTMTEKERLEFTDAPKRNPKQFSALLPFAVALGVEKEWARQFAGIDLDRATSGWYHGATPLHAGSFGSELSSFSGAINSNFAPISSSSGGSGGGSSGGGSGGGGGGSW